MSQYVKTALQTLAPYLPYQQRRHILCEDWSIAEQLRRTTLHPVYTKEISTNEYTDVVLDAHSKEFDMMLERWIRTKVTIHIIYTDRPPTESGDALVTMHKLLCMITFYPDRIKMNPTVLDVNV